jgi:chorismate mutase
MSKHRKSSGHKPPGDKKQKSNGKREVKKTVAAEIGAALMREEAPKPASTPVSRPARPVVVKEVAKEKALEPPPVSRPARPVVGKEVAKEKALEPPPVLRPARPEVVKEVAKEKPLEPPAALLGNPLDTFERSFKAAGQAAVAVNQKLIDFARANVQSGFDFAMRLATASSPMQMMQLQVSYWDERMKVLAPQAEELRVLSADLMAKTSEPIRQHMWAKRTRTA